MVKIFLKNIKDTFHALIHEWVVFVFSFVLVILYQLIPRDLEFILYGFLFLGFIFPGIAHGALDNYLLLKPLNSWKKKLLFYVFYIGIMTLIFLIWMVSPILGLVLFILTSIWHFGQTDNLQFGIKSGWFHLLHGLLFFAYILLINWSTTLSFLFLLEINAPKWEEKDALFFGYASLIFLSLSVWIKATQKKGILLLYILVLMLIGFLPLIIGFAIYFLGIHSWSAWKDIQMGLKFRHSEMLKNAALYTILAVIFIVAFLIWKGSNFNELNQNIAWFFIALSCISTPHIILMHYFYKKTAK